MSGSSVDTVSHSRIEADLRQAQERLRLSEERFRSLIQSAPVGLAICDAHGTITSVNDAYCAIVGYTPDELVGHSFTIVFPSHVRDNMSALYRKRIADMKITADEYLVATKESEERAVFATVVPITDVDGSSTRAAFLLDITERKRIEGALHQTLHDLERSNAELQQFAYVASHDLRSPLTTISGYSQVLERRYRGRLDEAANNFLGAITMGVRRMTSLIDDLLTYSRAGAQEPEREDVDCAALLQDVIAQLDGDVHAANGTVSYGALPTVHADATGLYQLLQNLIGNGLKYRGDDPPHIDVSAARQDDGWLFSVRDNGRGIAPADQTRIFEAFQRIQTDGGPSGTGLGLAICQKIVERNGGRMWVESELGQGSTFFFTLPTAC